MNKFYATLMIAAMAAATVAEAAPVRRAPKSATVPQREFSYPDPEEIITEAPAGVTKLYKKDSYYWVPDWGYMYMASATNQLAEIVEGDDGYTYIHNPYSDFVSNSYLKGKREGDKIVCQLPQAIYQEQRRPGGPISTYYACVMDLEYGSSDYYILDEETTQVTYSVDDETGVISLDMDYIPTIGPWGNYNSPYRILGMVTDEAIWMSEGEAYAVMTPFEGEAVQLPEGLEVQTWDMSTSDGNGQHAQIAFDGNDVYIGGLLESMPSDWFKGTLADGKVTFESGQFLGMSNGTTFVYMIGTTYLDGSAYYIDELVFNYDAEKQVLECANPDDALWYSDAPGAGSSSIKVWHAPKFQKAPEHVDPTPLAPSFVQVFPMSEETGEGSFRFDLPIVNKDGYILDANTMYYNVFFDGELETFYPDDYSSLSDEMTNVPYTFRDGWAFYYLGVQHVVYYYAEGVQTIGLKLCNVVDGVTYESPVTTYNIESGEQSGIGSIDTAVTPVTTEWYGLNGIRVANPGTGIYISRTVMSDGSIRTSKVVRK